MITVISNNEIIQDSLTSALETLGPDEEIQGILTVFRIEDDFIYNYNQLNSTELYGISKMIERLADRKLKGEEDGQENNG